MTKAKYITFLILISAFIYGQDSVTLTITKVRTTNEKNIYWLKDENKNRYITFCECKKKKGDKVKVAVKDLIIEREIFRKKDLEN